MEKGEDKMEKRTVIVTGGNSGLGYQCAKNIAMKDKDYTLVLACRILAPTRFARPNIFKAP